MNALLMHISNFSSTLLSIDISNTNINDEQFQQLCSLLSSIQYINYDQCTQLTSTNCLLSLSACSNTLTKLKFERTFHNNMNEIIQISYISNLYVVYFDNISMNHLVDFLLSSHLNITSLSISNVHVNDLNNLLIQYVDLEILVIWNTRHYRCIDRRTNFHSNRQIDGNGFQGQIQIQQLIKQIQLHLPSI
jgi:hypothetical protein